MAPNTSEAASLIVQRITSLDSCITRVDPVGEWDRADNQGITEIVVGWPISIGLSDVGTSSAGLVVWNSGEISGAAGYG
jgi:hypothetical protein